MKNKALIRFVLVGGICFVTGLALLYGATGLLGLHYLISMTASIVVANTLGWLLNRCWTFLGSGQPWWVEYARYMSVSFSSNLITLVLMFMCVSVLGIHYLSASAIIGLLMLLFNFVVHRDWSFAPSKGSSRSS